MSLLEVPFVVALPPIYTHACLRIAERAQDKTPVRYLLSLEQMIENGYPIPSYLAETFEKPAGWVETKVETVDDTLLSPPTTPASRIYAMDCEMVCNHRSWNCARS